MPKTVEEIEAEIADMKQALRRAKVAKRKEEARAYDLARKHLGNALAGAYMADTAEAVAALEEQLLRQLGSDIEAARVAAERERADVEAARVAAERGRAEMKAARAEVGQEHASGGVWGEAAGSSEVGPAEVGHYNGAGQQL